MSDVRVTIGADSAQLESEFEKVKQSAGNLRKSVGDVGGVLEGDRRVENKMTAFVEGFKSAQNGADLLANTMGNLGDVFKSSLAVGVGLNVGAALVGMIGSAIQKTDELKKSAQAVGEELRAAFESGDSGRLESSIKKANDEIEKLRKNTNSLFGSGAARQGILDLRGKKYEAGMALIEISKQELEIQKLIAAEEWDKADAAQENLRYKKETAAIKDLQLDSDIANELINNLMDASKQRLKAKREERRKAKTQKDEQAAKEAANQVAKVEEAEKKAMDIAEKLRLGFINKITEAEITAMRETAKLKEMVERGVIKAVEEAQNEHRKALADADDKARKELEAKDKLRLEGNKQLLKDNRDILKQGWQEQKQRDDKAMQALQGGGGLQALQAQRLSDKQAEAARDKAAGILARDEIRRKYGGDALKMTKEEIADAKDRILGEQQLDKKKIEDAIDNIPKIEKEIARLVAKLGVK